MFGCQKDKKNICRTSLAYFLVTFGPFLLKIENILTNNCFCCRNNKNLFRTFSVNLVLILCPFGPQNWLLGLFDHKWLNLTIKCAPKWLTIHSLIKAFAAKRIKSVSEIFQSISGLFWVHFGPNIGFLGLWPPLFTLLFRHTRSSVF